MDSTPAPPKDCGSDCGGFLGGWNRGAPVRYRIGDAYIVYFKYVFRGCCGPIGGVLSHQARGGGGGARLDSVRTNRLLQGTFCVLKQICSSLRFLERNQRHNRTKVIMPPFYKTLKKYSVCVSYFDSWTFMPRILGLIPGLDTVWSNYPTTLPVDKLLGGKLTSMDSNPVFLPKCISLGPHQLLLRT